MTKLFPAHTPPVLRIAALAFACTLAGAAIAPHNSAATAVAFRQLIMNHLLPCQFQMFCED